MAQRGKPLGNKRQHEQAKARKRREKEARRAARKSGVRLNEYGEPITEEAEAQAGEETGEQEVESPPLEGESVSGSDDERSEEPREL